MTIIMDSQYIEGGHLVEQEKNWGEWGVGETSSKWIEVKQFVSLSTLCYDTTLFFFEYKQMLLFFSSILCSLNS